VFADELPPAGPTGVRCKLATNRHNLCSGSIELRTSDLQREERLGKNPGSEN
jgi:hypothetical protein